MTHLRSPLSHVAHTPPPTPLQGAQATQHQQPGQGQPHTNAAAAGHGQFKGQFIRLAEHGAPGGMAGGAAGGAGGGPGAAPGTAGRPSPRSRGAGARAGGAGAAPSPARAAVDEDDEPSWFAPSGGVTRRLGSAGQPDEGHGDGRDEGSARQATPRLRATVSRRAPVRRGASAASDVAWATQAFEQGPRELARAFAGRLVSAARALAQGKPGVWHGLQADQQAMRRLAGGRPLYEGGTAEARQLLIEASREAPAGASASSAAARPNAAQQTLNASMIPLMLVWQRPVPPAHGSRMAGVLAALLRAR